MRGLLGYRFQKWFAGDIKNWRKQPASKFDHQILESNVVLIVGSEYPAYEEKSLYQKLTSDDVQIDAEKNKLNKTKIQSEILGGEK